jgi:hypothetical protein
MKQIGSLFERYQKVLKAPQASVEKELIVVVKEVCGYDLQRTQVRYVVASRTIYLQVPSLLRSELKFYHTRILEALQARLGGDSAPKTIL